MNLVFIFETYPTPARMNVKLDVMMLTSAMLPCTVAPISLCRHSPFRGGPEKIDRATIPNPPPPTQYPPYPRWAI